MHQRMQNIQVMEQQQVIVVGDVRHDIIRVEMHVQHVVRYEVIIQVQREQHHQHDVI